MDRIVEVRNIKLGGGNESPKSQVKENVQNKGTTQTMGDIRYKKYNENHKYSISEVEEISAVDNNNRTIQGGKWVVDPDTDIIIVDNKNPTIIYGTRQGKHVLRYVYNNGKKSTKAVKFVVVQ